MMLREWLGRNQRIIFISGFILAVFLRLVLIPNQGFEADVAFWKSWSLATHDHGIVKSLHTTNNNYPAPFVYVLWLMMAIYKVLADPHNFNEFWSNTNVWFLTVAKLFPILADFGIAGIIIWMTSEAYKSQIINHNVQRGNEYIDKKIFLVGIWLLRFKIYEPPIGVILALLYLLNPISLIDGAWWGQVDSLGVFLFLVACVLLFKRLPFWAGLIYMLSMLTKLQNMIYGPLFFLFAWQLLGSRNLIKCIAGAVVGFIGLNLPFILARDMGRVIDSLTTNYDYFPWMSLNAFNPWWIFSGGAGMQMTDRVTILGILNAKAVGLMIFSSMYLMAVLHLLSNFIRHFLVSKQGSAFEKTDNPNHELIFRFFSSLIIINAAFFLFQTQSHDRYLFPTSVFLLLLVPFLIKLYSPRTVNRELITIYIVFSLVYFYNLHTALVLNYPNNGLPILSQLTQKPLTIMASILNSLMFGGFFVLIRKQINKWTLILPIAALAGLLIIKNWPLITKKSMSLTNLVPIVQEQGYGLLVKNMPTNASGGTKSWTPLSSQYVFYRKGWGTHANSRLEFDINGLFKEFSTDMGVDTEAGERASVIFEIYGDEKLLFRTNKLGRYTYPEHAQVDVGGVKRLKLIVTDAGDGITDDHADWLNPLLFP